MNIFNLLLKISKAAFLFLSYSCGIIQFSQKKRSPHSQPVRFPQAIAKNKKSEAAQTARFKSDNFMT